jgi:hypothetical protein
MLKRRDGEGHGPGFIWFIGKVDREVTFSSLLPRERRNQSCSCVAAIPALFTNMKNPHKNCVSE